MPGNQDPDPPRIPAREPTAQKTKQPASEGSPDYLITAVRYDTRDARILAVQVRSYDGSSVAPPSQMTRNELLASLDWGYTFVTAYLRDRLWQRGALVRKLEIDGRPWIRTDAACTNADDLGELPTY